MKTKKIEMIVTSLILSAGILSGCGSDSRSSTASPNQTRNQAIYGNWTPSSLTNSSTSLQSGLGGPISIQPGQITVYATCVTQQARVTVAADILDTQINILETKSATSTDGSCRVTARQSTFNYQVNGTTLILIDPKTNVQGTLVKTN